MSQKTESYLRLIRNHLIDGAAIYSFNNKHLVDAEFLETGYYITEELYTEILNMDNFYHVKLKTNKGQIVIASVII
jgi:hypothetical protein